MHEDDFPKQLSAYLDVLLITISTAVCMANAYLALLIGGLVALISMGAIAIIAVAHL